MTEVSGAFLYFGVGYLKSGCMDYHISEGLVGEKRKLRSGRSVEYYRRERVGSGPKPMLKTAHVGIGGRVAYTRAQVGFPRAYIEKAEAALVVIATLGHKGGGMLFAHEPCRGVGTGHHHFRGDGRIG